MSANIKFFILFFLLILAHTANALDVGFRDITRHENTIPNDPWSGTSLSLSDGNAYISDKAVGVQLHVSPPVEGDSFGVNFVDPDGVKNQQRLSYMAQTDGPDCWVNPNNIFYRVCWGNVDIWWQFITTDINYGKPGIWTVEVVENEKIIHTATFGLIPRSLRKTGGDGQTIIVAEDGSFESQPLSVQLIDYDGSSPYAGEIVTFAVESSPKGNKGGGLTPSSATTGPDGIASVNFTPGSSAGTYSIVATTRSAPDKPQTFSVSVEVPSSTHGKAKDPLEGLNPPKNHGVPNELICEASPMTGNPINLGTGNKYQHELDYSSADSFPLIFDRHYNSDSPAGSSLGDYWRGTYDRSIVVYNIGKGKGKTQAADVYRSNGKVYTFTLNNSVWQGDPDVADRLIKTANGWRYVQKNNQVEEYDASGRLVKLLDRNGLAQQLDYNGANKLVQVSSSFGPTLTFTYDSFGKLASMTDAANNNTYQYHYDTAGNLIRVQYPDASSRQYLYENTSFPHALTGIIDENGVRFATWHYDESGRAVSSEHAGGTEKIDILYNIDGSRIVTDSLGQIKTHFIKNSHGSVKVSGVNSKTCPSCPLLDNASFNYDNKGYPNSTLDANGNTDYLSYNERGLQISHTKAARTAEEQTSTQVWHETLNLPVAIHEPGRSTYYSYDNNGNVLEKRRVDTATKATQIWTYTYTPLGSIETEDGPRTDVNDVTSYQYYPNGRLQRIVNALGQALEVLDYDSHGRPLKLKDENAVITTLNYDLRGRLTSRDTGGEVTGLSYDSTGRLVQTALPDQTTINYEYDGAGRLVLERDNWNNEIRYQYDNNSHLTNRTVHAPDGTLEQQQSWSYDPTGKLISATDAAGHITHYRYDNNGNLTGVTDAKSQQTTRDFDALDRPVATHYPDAGVVDKVYDKQNNLTAVIDAEGHTTNYRYNGLGQRMETDSPDTGITRYSYDKAGNLISEERANGKSVNYQYDALNRLLRASSTDGSIISYHYDSCNQGAGRFCSVIGSDFSSSWKYDNQGRVTERHEASGSINSVISYQYNALGQLSDITYPSGKTVSYHYVDGRIDHVTINGVTLLDQIAYNAANQVTGWNWANGEMTLRSYNQTGQLIQQTLADTDRSLTYDAVGNILNIDEGFNQYGFDYDPMNRLISATADHSDLLYSYDKNGNRLTEDDGISLDQYNYDPASNRLTERQGVLAKNYHYDEAGNTLSDGLHTYSYDAKNQLVEVAGVAAYFYNGLGQRISKTVSGVQIHYVHDENGRLTGEYNATGEAIQETVYLFGQPVAVLRGDDIYNVHADHLGSPRKITDQAGNLVWQWQDKPFGDSPVNQDPDGDGIAFVYSLRFPGQYYDAETGLHYNYFRYYDPRTGRYITSDPIGLAGGLNTYAYVNGNPVILIDPSGLVPCLSCHSSVIDWYNPNPYQSTYNGGLATGPAPYTHNEERAAREVIPNPFGDNCEEMKNAIKVLREQIKWRYTDLNPDSASYAAHLRHIKILEKELLKLESAYENICGEECPS
jgi:RHS repeat-associated protein